MLVWLVVCLFVRYCAVCGYWSSFRFLCSKAKRMVCGSWQNDVGQNDVGQNDGLGGMMVWVE